MHSRDVYEPLRCLQVGEGCRPRALTVQETNNNNRTPTLKLHSYKAIKRMDLHVDEIDKIFHKLVKRSLLKWTPSSPRWMGLTDSSAPQVHQRQGDYLILPALPAVCLQSRLDRNLAICHVSSTSMTTSSRALPNWSGCHAATSRPPFMTTTSADHSMMSVVGAWPSDACRACGSAPTRQMLAWQLACGGKR